MIVFAQQLWNLVITLRVQFPYITVSSAERRPYSFNKLKLITRCAAIAETARVTIRSVIAVDRLTLTVTLNMIYVNFISLIELSLNVILYAVVSYQL